eukprot:TRINITY_DN3499_c1_g1_i1.p1 TRINITY_DN3499_c1_g1~~TRINITY_DN3499_c1_g1_i1.p1  ORF type:complete len:173 (-),score=37.23 TRINITY_DN3499_c1_g1_i1:8-526(-)
MSSSQISLPSSDAAGRDGSVSSRPLSTYPGGGSKTDLTCDSPLEENTDAETEQNPNTLNLDVFEESRRLILTVLSSSSRHYADKLQPMSKEDVDEVKYHLKRATTMAVLLALSQQSDRVGQAVEELLGLLSKSPAGVSGREAAIESNEVVNEAMWWFAEMVRDKADEFLHSK